MNSATYNLQLILGDARNDKQQGSPLFIRLAFKPNLDNAPALTSETRRATSPGEIRHFATLLNSGDPAMLLPGARHAPVRSADVHIWGVFLQIRTFTKGVFAMNRKIALEEHIESPDFPATGTHNFTDPLYFDDVENRLQEYKLRLEDMDATGIETTILSLTQPGVEGITQAKCA